MVDEKALMRWSKFKRKRERQKEKEEKAEPAVPMPRWVPPGLPYAHVPKEVQTALVEIVNTVYEQLVAQAPDALEKSTGLTLVNLLWLEIVDQFDMGRTYSSDAFINTITCRPELIARYFQLIDAKMKASFMLARLRELRAREGGGAGPSRPDPPPAIPGPAVVVSSEAARDED